MTRHGLSRRARPDDARPDETRADDARPDDARPDDDARPRNEEHHSPFHLSGDSWKGTFKRTLKEFKADGLTDWAATLTYYGILAIFPALLALVSIIGLMGQSAATALTDNLDTFAPNSVHKILTDAIDNIAKQQSTAGITFAIGLLVALWSASGYVGAFMRAGNAVWDVQEGRPFWKKLPLRYGVTVALVVLLAIGVVLTVVSGDLASKIGSTIGLSGAAVTTWQIAKWPVLLLIVIVILAILYAAAPNVRGAGFRWITPGAALAVLIWIVASGLFAVYVATFGSYNRTYGSLAGVIIFLLWMWISNIAILLGLEFDAELYRSRRIEAGMDPADEPYIEMRDTRKLPDT